MMTDPLGTWRAERTGCFLAPSCGQLYGSDWNEVTDLIRTDVLLDQFTVSMCQSTVQMCCSISPLITRS